MYLANLNRTFQKSAFFTIIFISLFLSLYAQDVSKEEQLKEAQIKNQLAQSNYYDKLSKDSNTIWTSTAITTLLSVIVVIISVSLSHLFLSRIERKKWEQTRIDELDKWDRTRKDELEKWNRLRDDEKEKRLQAKKDEISREARLAAADLMKKVAIASHSMTWASWVARNDVEHFTVDLIKDHDKIMKSLYTELVSAQVVLASFNKLLYEKTREMVKSVYYYDEEFALLGKVIDDADKINDKDAYYEKVKKMGEFWDKIYKFSIKLPSQFADLLDVKPDSQTVQKVEEIER